MLASCGQMTPLHSARTEGAGNLTLTPTIDGTGYINQIRNTSEAVIVPGLRAEIAYGLTDHFDVIASLNASGSIKSSLKYQIYGDNFSSFAFAAMPGYEYQSNLINGGTQDIAQRLHFPFIFSIRATETFDYYVGPNLVLQFTDDPQNTAFPGAFGGLEFGQRIKVNIGAGFFLPYTFNIGTDGYLYQFGISARVPLIRRTN